MAFLLRLRLVYNPSPNRPFTAKQETLGTPFPNWPLHVKAFPKLATQKYFNAFYYYCRKNTLTWRGQFWSQGGTVLAARMPPPPTF